MPTTGSVKHRPKGVSNTDRREYQTPINRPTAKLKKTEVTANPAKRVITCILGFLALSEPQVKTPRGAGVVVLWCAVYRLSLFIRK